MHLWLLVIKSTVHFLYGTDVTDVFLSSKLLVWKKNKCFYFGNFILVICAISMYCVFPLMPVRKYIAVRFARYCAPLDVVTDKCPVTLH